MGSWNQVCTFKTEGQFTTFARFDPSNSDTFVLNHEEGNDITVCSVSAGAQKDKLTGFACEVTCVAFSKSGKYIAGADKQGNVLVFNFPTREVAKKFSVGHEVESVCFADDEERLLVGGRTLTVYKWSAGKKY